MGVRRFLVRAEDKQTRLAWQIAWIFGAMCLPYYFVFYYFHLTIAKIFVFPTAAVYLISIGLFTVGAYKSGKMLMIVGTAISLVFYASLLGGGAGAQFLLFSLVPVPFLFFTVRDKMAISFCAVVPMICGVILHYSHYEVLPFREYPMVLEQHLIAYFAITTTFLLLAFSSIAYFISTERHEKEMAEKNTDLNESLQKLALSYAELKENKITIQQLQQQAAYASLTRGIAHEIRNPLGMIQSCWEIVVKNLHRPDVVSEFSQGVDENIHRLLTITETMLDYGGTSAQNKVMTNLNKAIQEVITLSKAKAGAVRIELSTQTGDIPAVLADPDAVVQVLINVVLNAIEAISDTGHPGKITIESRHHQENAWVEVLVKDTGPGISIDVQSKLFDSFFTTKHSNHGLGLSIVMKLMADHDGSIAIESTPDIQPGTTIILRFPTQQALKE